MAEWSKALAWKVSIRQNRIEGSNPSRSATEGLEEAPAKVEMGEVSDEVLWEGFVEGGQAHRLCE